MYIIPAWIPVHKEIKSSEKRYPSFDERFEMTKLAFSELSCRTKCDITVSDIEKDGGKSYTVLTVRKLLKTEKAPLYLYVGTDMFLCFDTWHCFKELLDNCVICVMPRDGEREEIFAKKEMFEREHDAKIIFIDAVPEVVSSSEIRRDISSLKSSSKVLPAVMDYIKCKGLYL